MNAQNNSQAILLNLCVAIAIITAAVIFSITVHRFKTADRSVNVKGFAEKEVAADMAIWPITFKEATDNLESLQSQIDQKRDIVTEFLIQAGFKNDEISFSAPKILDTQAPGMYGEKVESRFRYIANAAIIIRSSNVDLVRKSIENTVNLVGKGVALSPESWENRTEFIYTSLDKIKPEMIESATKNARSAAEKFALDSGSKLGKIRHASQGLFTIEDRDVNSPYRKKVRVVTTIEYYLR